MSFDFHISSLCKTKKEDLNKEIWEIEDLSEQASQKDGDEIQRQILRGDESEGNPDNRDVAGGTKSAETPQGREETKQDSDEKANSNG